MRGLVLGFWALMVLIKLSLLGLLVWAIIHFVGKYW